jgi:urease subunit beta
VVGVIPGQVWPAAGSIGLNEGRPVLVLEVVNTGDRPVQVGSHFHLPQANAALSFDRAAAHGHRLDVPAGTSVRFEPGIAKAVPLVPLGGARYVGGLSLDPPGALDPASSPHHAPTPDPEG